MDNKFIAPGSRTSNAWCCNCAKERHAWHEFDRFACRHCVKRDKTRPATVVVTPPDQQLRCASSLPKVGRSSAAVTGSAAANVIPTAHAIDGCAGGQHAAVKGLPVRAGLLGEAAGGTDGIGLCHVHVGTLPSANAAEVGVVRLGAETPGAGYGDKPDRGDAHVGKGCAAGCCCS